uniref:Nuclease associated modular domain-containing protein n=1 Tax=Kalanchoe fedtschenkoi TaxID=63787 RepID=A0A7N0T2M7_KALFE
MPLLLDIATPHISVHSNQSAELTLGGQPPGSFWSNFMPPNARDPRSFSNSFKISFSLRHVQMQHSQPIITNSVASFENNQAMLQNVVFKEGFCDSPRMEQLSASQDSVELEQKERLRRERISKANKGNSPWNKGRKHSPETIQKIRERTRLAMQDPKVKNKLVNLGHAQSQQTKLKIGAGVRMGWEKRRNKLKLQETCCLEWQNLIAESSRNGLSGEEELDWCSYRVLGKQLLQEWSQSVELRRNARKVKGDKRAPKSAEQRKRISQAITAKWKDPVSVFS